MPFEIVRNDITNMDVDAIVNTANPEPVVGYGTDMGIHRRAGPRLLKARQAIGSIGVGSATITSGFGLKARYVIHTVGPVWLDGSHKEEMLLRSCYEQSLKLAKRYGCQSIAFPLISAGSYGFPKPLALEIALNAIGDFLLKNEMQVYLVVFNREAFQLSEKLFRGVSSFIDDNYVLKKSLQQYNLEDTHPLPDIQQEMARRMRQRQAAASTSFEAPPPPCMAAPPLEPESKKAAPERKALKRKASTALPCSRPKASLADLLKKTDAGFSETLLKLIDRTGKKDSEIYTRANLSRQHFSKIRNNLDYKPTKATAIALALALELDLEQTRDLIGRAGYALTNSSKFDVIIMYFIQEGNYNLFDINAALFEFDQNLLGAC